MQRAPIGALCISSCRGSMACFYSAPLAWNPTAVDRFKGCIGPHLPIVWDTPCPPRSLVGSADRLRDISKADPNQPSGASRSCPEVAAHCNSPARLVRWPVQRLPRDCPADQAVLVRSFRASLAGLADAPGQWREPQLVANATLSVGEVFRFVIRPHTDDLGHIRQRTHQRLIAPLLGHPAARPSMPGLISAFSRRISRGLLDLRGA